MKKLFILITLISASTYSLSKPLYEGSGDNKNTKPEKGICDDENDICGFNLYITDNKSLNVEQQNGRNPKTKKKGKNSKNNSKSKSSKKENTKRNTTYNTPKRITPKYSPNRVTPKKKHSSDIGLGLIADVFGGYSNFMWSDGSPVSGLGFGAGVTGQLHLNETDYAPDGYFAELGINYARKGSGAYPINNVNANVLPLGYSFNHLLGDFSLFIKAGGYISYPFSDLKTKQKSFDTNLDYGAIGCVGVSYEKFSVSVSYEHGFVDVCDANVSLKNQNIFLTLSYRLF